MLISLLHSIEFVLFSFPGEGQLGTDENMFNTILTTRSWAQLRQIMNEYQTLHGHGLEKAVVKEFSADAEKGLLGICKISNIL